MQKMSCKGCTGALMIYATSSGSAARHRLVFRMLPFNFVQHEQGLGRTSLGLGTEVTFAAMLWRW